MLVFLLVLGFFSTSLATPGRGIGLAVWNCDDPPILNVSWYYNWNYKPPCNYWEDIPFIPMIWGANDVQYTSQLKNTGYQALLGFNEPDASNQADMSVQEALNYWPQLMDTGLRLGSPAATQWGAFSWLKQFMDGVKQNGYRVDFLCFHWYAYEGSTINDLKNFLDEVKSTYPGYSFWVTEFANATGSYNDEIDMMNGAINLFSESTYPVERYAWFTNEYPPTGEPTKKVGPKISDGDTPNFGLIYENSGGQLTPSGQVYVTIPNQ